MKILLINKDNKELEIEVDENFISKCGILIFQNHSRQTNKRFFAYQPDLSIKRFSNPPTFVEVNSFTLPQLLLGDKF